MLSLFKPYRLPDWVEKLFPDLHFTLPATDNTVYLTFDDGPTPGATEFVLEELDKYGFGATFFLIGDKIRPHADLVQQIKAEGHRLGNHTFHHVNAFKTPLKEYLGEILETQEILDCLQASDKPLFRPPYGKITPRYAREIIRQGFEIIMWKRLSLDYKPDTDLDESLSQLKETKPGDIIVFHDSEKAFENLRHLLPPYLAFLKAKGWTSKPIFL